MKYHLFYILYLLFVSGCVKKQTSSLAQEKQSVPVLKTVPQKLTLGDVVLVPGPLRQTSATPSGNMLQLIFGLRDAVQNKAHVIQPLAQGSLFLIEKIPTSIIITGSYSTMHSDQEEKYTLKAQQEGSSSVFTLTHTLIDEESLPHTTISLKPQDLTSEFSSETLEGIKDACESTYASNETTLVVDFNGKKSSLCTRGASSHIFLHLKKNEILADVVAFSISPEEFLMTLVGVSATKKLSEEPPMKKILHVLMPKDFQELEFQGTYTALLKKGYTVDVAGLTSGDCIGSEGMRVTPDKILFNITSENLATYDALVITGGFGSTTFLWGNKDLHEVVRYFHAAKKLIAAICYASIVPVEAGLLTEKEATVYPTDVAKEILKKHGVIFKDVPCVVLKTENIITGQGPAAVQDFASAVIENLTTSSSVTLESSLHG